MMAHLWDVLKRPFSLASVTKSTKISFSSFQEPSLNSFVNPSIPGDLSFWTLFRDL